MDLNRVITGFFFSFLDQAFKNRSFQESISGLRFLAVGFQGHIHGLNGKNNENWFH